MKHWPSISLSPVSYLQQMPALIKLKEDVKNLSISLLQKPSYTSAEISLSLETELIGMNSEAHREAQAMKSLWTYETALSSFTNIRIPNKPCPCSLCMPTYEQLFQFHKLCTISKTGIAEVGKNLEELEALMIGQNLS